MTGFRGALGVSQAILNGGRSSELRSLRRELDLHLLIRRSMHQFQQADYSRLVDWMNDAMLRSLSSVTRDEAARRTLAYLPQPAPPAADRPAGAADRGVPSQRQQR